MNENISVYISKRHIFTHEINLITYELDMIAMLPDNVQEYFIVYFISDRGILEEKRILMPYKHYIRIEELVKRQKHIMDQPYLAASR